MDDDDDIPEWKFDTVRVASSSAVSSLQQSQPDTTSPPPAHAASLPEETREEQTSPAAPELVPQETVNHNRPIKVEPPTRPISAESGRETVFSSFSDVSLPYSDSEEGSHINGLIPGSETVVGEDKIPVNGIHESQEPVPHLVEDSVQPKVWKCFHSVYKMYIYSNVTICHYVTVVFF